MIILALSLVNEKENAHNKPKIENKFMQAPGST